MTISLSIVLMLLLSAYAAQQSIESLLEWRSRRPRPTFSALVAENRDWAAWMIITGFVAVLFLAIAVALIVTGFDTLLALTGVERLTFAIAVAVFAGLFYGSRYLFRAFTARRWVRALVFHGTMIVSIGFLLWLMNVLA